MRLCRKLLNTFCSRTTINDPLFQLGKLREQYQRQSTRIVKQECLKNGILIKSNKKSVLLDELFQFYKTHPDRIPIQTKHTPDAIDTIVQNSPSATAQNDKLTPETTVQLVPPNTIDPLLTVTDPNKAESEKLNLDIKIDIEYSIESEMMRVQANKNNNNLPQSSSSPKLKQITAAKNIQSLNIAKNDSPFIVYQQGKNSIVNSKTHAKYKIGQITANQIFKEVIPSVFLLKSIGYNLSTEFFKVSPFVHTPCLDVIYPEENSREILQVHFSTTNERNLISDLKVFIKRHSNFFTRVRVQQANAKTVDDLKRVCLQLFTTYRELAAFQKQCRLKYGMNNPEIAHLLANVRRFKHELSTSIRFLSKNTVMNILEGLINAKLMKLTDGDSLLAYVELFVVFGNGHLKEDPDYMHSLNVYLSYLQAAFSKADEPTDNDNLVSWACSAYELINCHFESENKDRIIQYVVDKVKDYVQVNAARSDFLEKLDLKTQQRTILTIIYLLKKKTLHRVASNSIIVKLERFKFTKNLSNQQHLLTIAEFAVKQHCRVPHELLTCMNRFLRFSQLTLKEKWVVYSLFKSHLPHLHHQLLYYCECLLDHLVNIRKYFKEEWKAVYRNMAMDALETVRLLNRLGVAKVNTGMLMKHTDIQSLVGSSKISAQQTASSN